MSFYKNYCKDIEERSVQGLKPKPIDDADLLIEIIKDIKDVKSSLRKKSLDFFVYNVLPGTTSAARVKANFLKEIILGKHIVEDINITFAFELLSHMKGGPSVEVLIDLSLKKDLDIQRKAADVLKLNFSCMMTI